MTDDVNRNVHIFWPFNPWTVHGSWGNKVKPSWDGSSFFLVKQHLAQGQVMSTWPLRIHSGDIHSSTLAWLVLPDAEGSLPVDPVIQGAVFPKMGHTPKWPKDG